MAISRIEKQKDKTDLKLAISKQASDLVDADIWSWWPNRPCYKNKLILIIALIRRTTNIGISRIYSSFYLLYIPIYCRFWLLWHF